VQPSSKGESGLFGAGVGGIPRAVNRVDFMQENQLLTKAVLYYRDARRMSAM
jgi:hypothetical protein